MTAWAGDAVWIGHDWFRPNGATMSEANDDLSTSAVPKREPEVNKLFRTVMKHEGSDLHLKAGLPPMMRLKNVIRRMDHPPIYVEEMQNLLFAILTERQKKIFEDEGGVDFA